MSTNAVKTLEIQVVPFFARFLQEQSASEKPDTNPPPPPFTFKYPSDFEDL